MGYGDRRKWLLVRPGPPGELQGEEPGGGRDGAAPKAAGKGGHKKRWETTGHRKREGPSGGTRMVPGATSWEQSSPGQGNQGDQ